MTDPLRVVHKKTGNFLEDFKPGQLFRHKGGKTVTEGLFTLFSDFSMGTNPFSKNARYARAYGYRDLTCSPGMVIGGCSLRCCPFWWVCIACRPGPPRRWGEPKG